MSKPAGTDRQKLSAGEGGPPVVIDVAGRAVVEIPRGDLLLAAQYQRLGDDLLLTAADGTTVLLRGFFSGTGQPLLRDASGAEMPAEMIALLATSPAEGQVADAAGTAGPVPVGVIERVDGSAGIVRADGSRAIASAGTLVFERDAIETAAGSRLAILLADEAALAMDASTRLVIDGFRGERDAAGHFTFVVLKGTVAYIGSPGNAPGGVAVMTPQTLISAGDASFLIRVDDRPGGPYATDFFGYAGGATLSTAGSILFVSAGEAARLPGLGGTPAPILSRPPEQVAVDDGIWSMVRAAQANGPVQSGWTTLPAEASPDTATAGDDPALAQIASISPAAGGPGPAPLARPSIGGGTIVTMVEIPGSLPVPTGVAPPAAALSFPDLPALPTPFEASILSPPDSDIADLATGPQASDPPSTPEPPVNQVPLAVADQATVQEDGPPVAIQVLLNDIDADAGDMLTIQGVGITGTIGSVGIAGAGVTYDPGTNFQSLAAGATAIDTFTYTIADPAGATATATVVVTVTGVNDAPIASADAISVPGDSGVVSIDVLANDIDPDDGDVLAVIGVDTSGSIGSVAFSASGLTYSPGSGFQFLSAGSTATDSFAYTVRDNAGLTSTAVVTVTVVGVNNAPIAVGDSATAAEDGGPIAIDVLGNDTDLDAADALSIQSVDTAGTVGTVTFAPGGIAYDPGTSFQALGAGAVAADSFTYTIVDSGGLTSTARVNVTVTGANDAPVATADAAAAVRGAGAIAVAVLANDTDADAGDLLGISAVDTTGTIGIVGISGTSLTYDPGSGFAGLAPGATAVDTFTYTIVDSAGAFATAMVTVTVSATNFAPLAVADAAAAQEDGGPIAIDVLVNDMDPDAGDSLAIVSVGMGGTLGTVGFTGTSITYDPGSAFQELPDGATAIDSFTYTIADSGGLTSTAVVTVTVTGVNDAPLAVADTALASEDGGPVAISVLANDMDPDDGDALSVIAVDTAGTQGGVTFSASGVTYDPGAGFQALAAGMTATDSFNYTIRDAVGEMSSATVTVTIAGTNDAPVAAGDTANAVEDGGPIVISVLGNDSDIDAGDTLSILSVDTAGTTGSVSILGDTLVYDPGNGFTALTSGSTTTDTFTYTLRDAAGLTSVATVTVTVSSLDDNLIGGGGADLLNGAAGSDTLSGNGGNDTLLGGIGNDLLIGGTGNDSLDGGEGDDTYRLSGTGEGTDTFRDTGTGGTDTILALAAGTVIRPAGGFSVASSGIEVISGNGFANVSVLGGAGSETFDFTGVTLLDLALIDAGSGNDTVIGSAGDDVILGNAGNDTLLGAAGADTIRGAAGNDSLDGGEGDDTYLLSGTGDGTDIFRDTGTGGTDTILALAAGTVIRPAGGVSLASSGIEVISGNGFANVSILGGTGSEVFDFTGVTLLDIALIDAGSGNDTVTGSAGDDAILGNAGNDTLLGAAGADTIRGAAGNDSLDGGEGDDTYLLSGTGDGTDIFRDTGTGGTDTILALAAGTVIRPAGGFSLASSGIEVISGNGFANVSVLGGTGSEAIDFTDVTLLDIALIDAGSGNDTVTGSAGDDVILGNAGNDSLDGGEGGDTYRVTGTGHGSDIYRDSGTGGVDRILATANNTSIGILGDFSAALTGIEEISAGGFVNVVLLGNTTANSFDLTGVTLSGLARIDAGAGNDTVTGSAGGELLFGNTGNDSLDGAEGDDTLQGGTGNDSLDGGEDGDTYLVTGTGDGADTFRDTGAVGTDRIVATANNTRIGILGDFSTVLTGIEEISANGFSNVILLGDAGANSFDLTGITLDSVVIDGGSGNDSILGSTGDDLIQGGAGNDNLDGGEGSDTYRVTGTGSGADVYADTGAAGLDRIVALANATAIGLSGFGLASGIEEISAGGFANVRVVGTTVADGLDFSATALVGITQIDAGSGNDTVIGSAGADVILGNSGNDSLDGGEGGDTYLVTGTGHGADLFRDTGAAGTDRIIATANNTRIGILGDFSAVLTGIEEISANGFSNVTLLGDAAANSFDLSGILLDGIVIDGGSGNDSILGSAADDLILGGAGNDSLDGGEGGDTYRVTGTGHGADLFRDTGVAGTDRIVATANNTNIGIQGDFSGFLTGIEEISANGFSNVALLGDGNADNFDLSGVALSGLARIDAGGGNDTVVGSAGADVILGNAGNDRLDGGLGNDTLIGGAGDDVFVMDLLSGQDRINDFAAGGVLDRIDLTAITLADVDADGRDLDDVLALASMDGTNALLDFGGGNTLTLVNVSLAALQPVDFIL